MKKIILLAMFSIAGVVSANNLTLPADQETTNGEVKLCMVYVTYYDSEGIPYDFDVFGSDQPDLGSCLSFQNSVLHSVRSHGYSISNP